MPTVDLIKSTTVVTTTTTTTTAITSTTSTSTTTNNIISNNSATIHNNSNNNNNNNFEQYQRLQLYNYALHIERFRGPISNSNNNTHNSYPAAAAAAAAAMAAMAHTLHYTPTPTATNATAIMQPHHHQHRQQPLQHSHLPSSASAAVGLHCHNSLNSNKSLTAAAAAAAAAAAFSVRNMLPQHSRLLFQREEPKPQHSYIGLIAMAILSSAETKLVLSDIYQYILDNYPYFRSRGPGWRNSIRHNLSLNDCFVKSGRSANGKGHYWAIHPANLDDFRKGDFRRRKAQRKVRRHMGLSVDDGADSPSPPPIVQPTTLQTIDNTTATTALDLWQHNPLKINAARAATLIAASLQQRHHTVTSNNSNINNSIYTAVPMTYNQQMLNFQQQQQQMSQPLYYGGGCGDNFYAASRKLDSTSSSTVIANFYSQTRKRQFDVASLLAPDVQEEETETEKLTQVVDRDLELDMETETNLRNSDTCSLESPPCISEPDTTDIMIDVVAHDDEELHKERSVVDEDINVDTSNSKQRTYVYATFEVDKCDQNKEVVSVGDDIWQHVPLTAAASYYEFVTTSHYLQQTQQAQPIQTTNESTTSASQHVLRHYCGSYMSQNTTAPPTRTTTTKPHLDDKLSSDETR